MSAEEVRNETLDVLKELRTLIEDTLKILKGEN